jgi:hypothetical protein
MPPRPGSPVLAARLCLPAGKGLRGGGLLPAVRAGSSPTCEPPRGFLEAPIARSILVIVWHLLGDLTARFHDLGAGYYTSRIDKDRETRNHVRQLQALGYAVTLTPAA